jgi:hypothetical protein
MFSDLRDYVSLWFYWRWPSAEGEITAVRIQSGRQLLLDYRFSVGDRPYTGEADLPSWFADREAIDINETFRIGQLVTVRYRRDDPGVNKLDPSVWHDIEGL